MIEKICAYLTKKIRKEMPEIDDERAEAIEYGIQLIVGEIPKIFLLFGLGFLLNAGWLTIFAFFVLLPYKGCSGGFHLKSHIGCIVGTCVIYLGNVLLSKNILLEPFYLKYILILATWIFGLVMVKMYAPADTVNVPILSTKERKMKKRMSYITLTATLLLACILKDNVLSNILILGILIQTVSITKIAYKVTKNEYGYEVYQKENNVPV